MCIQTNPYVCSLGTIAAVGLAYSAYSLVDKYAYLLFIMLIDGKSVVCGEVWLQKWHYCTNPNYYP